MDSVISLPPEKRAQLGIFMSFQYPAEVPGVSISNFLRTAVNALRKDNPMKPMEFMKHLKAQMELLKVDDKFVARYLNEGFSGGEKKKCEILQLAVLRPGIAILDETDSGLDIDALKTVASGVNKLAGPEMGMLLITHYQRILKFIKPDQVHIMIDGQITRSGDHELAGEIEEKGYQQIRVVT